MDDNNSASIDNRKMRLVVALMVTKKTSKSEKQR